MTTAQWKKSSRSANNGTCVELAVLGDRMAARDSKNPGGPMLTFPTLTFRRFLRGS